MEHIAETPVRRHRKKFHTTPLRVIVFILLLLVTTSYLVMLGWAFLASLKGKVEYVIDKVSLPKDWLFSNYAEAWQKLSASGKSVPQMVLNALWISLGGILINDLTAPAIAYVYARYRFPGRKLLGGISLFMMMVPILGSLPATYKMYLNLGIYDSPLILITNAGGLGFSLILWSGCLKAVSWSMAEAAYIDGCNHFQVYFKIMLPQVLPILIALNIQTFLAVWNDYTTPLLFYPSYPTLASGLYTYQIESGRALNFPLLFAGVFMCAVPALIIFITFQKTFMSIDFSGGIKG